MNPQRIQLCRRKGWRMPENTVKVDRTSFYGNPYAVEPCRQTRAGESKKGFVVLGYETLFFEDRLAAVELSIRAFRAWIAAPSNSKLAPAVALLAGKNLACWCKPGDLCHADVLLELANKRELENVVPFKEAGES